MSMVFYIIWVLIGFPVAIALVLKMCDAMPPGEGDEFVVGLFTIVAIAFWPIGAIYLLAAAIGSFVMGKADKGSGCG